MPRGRVTLLVHHDWYIQQKLVIDSSEPPRDIVLDRGATWVGSVLDPEGHVIEDCDIFRPLARLTRAND